MDAAGHSYVLGMGLPPGGSAAVATLLKVAPDGSIVWTWRDVAGIGPVTNLVWGGDGRLIAIAGSGNFPTPNGFAVIDPATAAVSMARPGKGAPAQMWPVTLQAWSTQCMAPTVVVP